MVKVIKAENAGFCFGVKRAVDMTEKELINKNGNIYSLGPLIHNAQAVRKLEERGLKTIENISDINDGKVIIRAHGVPKSTIENIEKIEIDVVDTTCPYVISVHKKVEEFYKKGYNVVIVGDSNHPEIIGINGWCDNNGIIIKSEEEAKKIKGLDKVCVVSQTTNKKEKFDAISEIVEEGNRNVEIYNTICSATSLRQDSAREVSKNVDAMIVIGGYHSANTNKLVEVSKENCENVYHIETTKDLSLEDFSKFNIIGITAGASTPDWIIEEVIGIMDNIENNEMTMEMLEAIEKSFTNINKGDVLKGEVLFVTNNEVMVNINYKSDGIISKEELSNDPDVKPEDLYKVGDEINVYVMRVDDGDGNVVLSSKRVEDSKRWDELEEIYKNEEEVEVTVLNSVKGGLIVLVNGVSGFMPASHVSVRYVSDLSEYKGEKFLAKIIDFDNSKKRIILSRKEVEKKELDKKIKELWENLEVDTLIEGVVQRLTNFGAFVDIGGLDGLIHISDLSWNRIKNPSEVVSVGEKVEVKVLALDKERNRISLGLKQTKEEPWVVFSNKVKVNDIVDGTIVNLMDFGAFVRLKDGVDGLLHVSEISNDHVDKPSDILKVGEEIKVKIIGINEEDKKVSLSTKEDVESNEDLELKENEVESEMTIGDIVDK